MILRPRIAEPWLTVLLKLETQLIDYPIHQRRLIEGGFGDGVENLELTSSR